MTPVNRRGSKRPRDSTPEDEGDHKSRRRAATLGPNGASVSSDDSPASTSPLRFSQWSGVGRRPEMPADIPDSVGCVDRIFVRNFMCHESMEVDFNRRINFVIGRNGSGKSAILMALVVGLGGKASATNRGTSLKAFIKMGEPRASVEITLSNRGLGAYKRNTYGDSITIIRTLTQAQGTSNYRIKNHEGHVVSTRREELDRIITFHNIQVDNPVSVLNQDSSRTFLNSSDPRDKFNLFMRATQLEEIERLHALAHTVRTEGSQALKVKKQALAVHQVSVEALKKRWSLLKSVPEQRLKIEALENELAWAQAIEKEVLHAEAVKQEEVEAAKLAKIKQSLDSRKAEEQELADSLKRLNDRIAALQEERRTLGEHFAESKAAYLRHKDSLNNKVKDCRVLQTKVDRQKSNEAMLVAEIQRLELDNGESDALVAQQRAERATLEEQLRGVQASLHTSQVHYAHLLGNEQPMKHALDAIRYNIQDKERQIGKIEANIASMKKDTTGNASLFGAHFPALLDKIDKEKRFKRKPIGPIGAFIQLTDASWAPAIEQVLYGSLMSFRCDNIEDFNLLSKVSTARGGRDASAIRQRFLHEVLDTSRSDIPKDGVHLTMLSKLIISDTIVMNTILDTFHPGRILLLNSVEDAYRIMSNKDLVPRNCLYGITKNGDMYYPSPNYRTYCGQDRPARYLQVNKEGAIKALEVELKRVIREQDQAKVEYRQQEDRLKTVRKEIELERGEQSKMRRQEQQIVADISRLKEAEVVEDQSIAVLEGELEECRRALVPLEEQLAVVNADRVACKELMDTSFATVNQAKANTDLMANKIDPYITEMDAVKGRQRSLKTNATLVQERIAAQAARLATFTAESDKLRTAAERCVQNATELAPRIDTTKSAAKLAREKAVAEANLQSVESEQGSYIEVRQEYNDLKAKVDETMTLIQECHVLLKRLEETIYNRLVTYRSIRRLTTMKVMFYFKYRLNQRQYTGDVNIDRKACTLELSVTPAGRAESTGASSKDTRTLSGGERSYSTVVFIMALWDTVELPFYFMDEFDVFMDKANRRVIMDMLLEHARKSKRQFVFLTPQDTSTVESDQSITIHRMADPRSD